MKLLFCLVTAVLMLFSGSVLAEKEFVGTDEMATTITEVTQDPVRCSRESNEWGHQTGCVCSEGFFYNPKLGTCRHEVRDLNPIKGPIAEHEDVGLEESSETENQVTFRCYKSDKPGYRQSRCRCSDPDYKYDAKARRCVLPQDQESEMEEATADLVIPGCEGGSISSDGLVISCPDGSTYHRSRNTAEDLSRALAETVEDRYTDSDSEIEDPEYFPQPFASQR